LTFEGAKVETRGNKSLVLRDDLLLFHKDLDERLPSPSEEKPSSLFILSG